MKSRKQIRGTFKPGTKNGQWNHRPMPGQRPAAERQAQLLAFFEGRSPRPPSHPQIDRDLQALVAAGKLKAVRKRVGSVFGTHIRRTRYVLTYTPESLPAKHIHEPYAKRRQWMQDLKTRSI